MTRILIAEDEERIVSFLEKGLRAQGYTTLAVATGIDAAALARDDSFDLVVLDLGLPAREARLREIGSHMEAGLARLAAAPLSDSTPSASYNTPV